MPLLILHYCPSDLFFFMMLPYAIFADYSFARCITLPLMPPADTILFFAILAIIITLLPSSADADGFSAAARLR